MQDGEWTSTCAFSLMSMEMDSLTLSDLGTRMFMSRVTMGMVLSNLPKRFSAAFAMTKAGAFLNTRTSLWT